MANAPSATNADVLRWFWTFTKSMKWFFVFGSVATVISGIAESFVPYYYKELIDHLGGTPTAATMKILFGIFIMIVLLKLATTVFFRFSGLLVAMYEPRVMADVGLKTFTYVIRHSYQFFADAFSGSLVRRITRSSGAYETIIDQIFFSFIPLVINAALAFFLMASRSGTIALIAFVWFALTIGFAVVFIRRVQPISIAAASKDSEVSAAMTDAFSNSVNVKLFNGYEFEESRATDVLAGWRALTVKSWTLNETQFVIQGFLMVAVEGAVVYAAIRLWSVGKLTVGDFVMFQGFLAALMGKVWNLNWVVRRLFNAFSDAKEAADLLQTPHGIQDTKSAKPLVVRRGDIVFEHVGFSYKQTRQVLHDFTLTIKPGERVALVGPSGAGKSTVVKMLFRFFDPGQGKILIDGQDITRVTQDSLRQALSLVPQDPSLFHRTLMENIRYGKRDATEAEVIRAAKLAHCHEFIANLPDGYNTFVGERGIKLSGGERQRVAIARAILKNAPILVLDEATSSLDSESESLIQDALKTLMAGKTTLVIAHRLSTIMNMDRIVVMEEGRILEIGDHRTLLAKPTLYQKLWEIQAGGFAPQEG